MSSSPHDRPHMIANARMYSLTPAAAQAWRELLGWVLARAGLAPPWHVIDHPAPAPLPTLWDRPDAGCVFMCGLPFATRRPQAIPLAAPVPSPARYAGLPRYATDLVVRADAPWQTLEDTVDARLGFTETHSQSGCQAVAWHLRGWPDRHRRIGPLVTPRRVVQALIDREIDVGPLDSYAHDLLRHHEPALAAQLRTLATTAFTPMPLLVAARQTEPQAVQALRSALLGVADEPSLRPQREALLLTGFRWVAAEDYAVLAQRLDAMSAAAPSFVDSTG